MNTQNTISLEEVIDIVSSAYLDDMVAAHFRREKWAGDTLAKFIAQELEGCLHRVGDRKSMLDEALRLMRTARGDLEDVIQALEAARAGG